MYLEEKYAVIEQNKEKLSNKKLQNSTLFWLWSSSEKAKDYQVEIIHS